MDKKRNQELSGNDYIIRATAADGRIRAFAATTKNLVEEARRRHNTSPVATAALGRLLTAGAMMGSMMKGEKDVLTLRIQGDGPIGGITVTAGANADVKGCVVNPEVLIHANARGKLDVAGAVGRGTLTVIRDIGLKEPYSGQIDLVSGEIAEDLTYYYAVSEQTPSSVALGVLMNRENTVRQAGGFILQLMPDADDSLIDALEAHLAGITSITSFLDAGKTPENILEDILGEFGLELLDRIPTRFFCDCSEEKVEKALVSVGKEELTDMIAAGKPVEVTCHFCNEHYQFGPEKLQQILDRLERQAADK
ncbi:Hsp33 family molecular chaperone HslO [Fusibacillus kribbianus]|uniref:33 kDa chaperonin n=1 Tax=Fusibacillus kribbianus TaxID=3044208 RepID=A0AAP4EYW3_9FIRM|nr:Hsp33 family molecular chaperone HslO [Ruminococcus sp. YH-rum2234]MDI9241090.1 Hsp33 family molecular chaperone HslO [Ruminococcus sp. YH-rum2234]